MGNTDRLDTFTVGDFNLKKGVSNTLFSLQPEHDLRHFPTQHRRLDVFLRANLATFLSFPLLLSGSLFGGLTSILLFLSPQPLLTLILFSRSKCLAQAPENNLRQHLKSAFSSSEGTGSAIEKLSPDSRSTNV